VPAPGSTYVWKVDGINLNVLLSKAVLAELRAMLEGAAMPDPPEIGGILLGRVEGDGAGRRTFVDAFEPCERGRLERQRARRRRDGLVAVGLWRSHFRRGLYLDQRDFRLFRHLFHNPSSIFLLVRRDGGDQARGAVFVWEDDDVRRHASYLEFPLEALPLAGEIRQAKAPNAAYFGIRRTRFLQWNQVAARYKKADEGVRRGPGGPPHGWLKPAVLATLGLALPAASFYIGREMGLNRYRDAAVARATPAAPAPPPDVRPAPFPASPEVAPAEQPAIADSLDRVGSTPAVRTPRPLKIPLPAATATAPLAEPTLPDPPRVTPRPSLAPLPKVVAAAPAAPALYAKGVTAYVRPAPSSGIRHALHKIFAGSPSAAGFVPASPVDHPLPALPREEIPEGDSSVELLARIDRSGAVAHVKFADGNSDLTEPSASALSQWRFEPARQNGAPVDSDLLVRFEFRKKP